ncbi:MAG TPA: hypothetical protein VF177_23510 [Anaerolineae bacterium]
MKNKRKTWSRMVLGLVLLGLLIAFGLSTPVRAADFRSGNNVVIGAEEVIDDDLFVSGGRVEVNGTVQGDLFATGAEVIVNGDVEGSLAMAGQTLVVNGSIGGSVYGGGYSLTIGPEADIGRNVYFGGFSLVTESGSNIGRSLYTGSYQTIHSGEVANNLEVGSAALQVNGVVGGDVRGEVADPEAATRPFFMPGFPSDVTIIDPGLQVSDQAEIGGNVNVTVAQVDEGGAAGFFAFAVETTLRQRIGEFIALLIVGGILLRLWPGFMRRAGAETQERPLPSAGRGCLGTLIFFVAVPGAFLVLIGLTLLGGLITFGQLSSNILGLGGTALGFAVAAFLFVLTLVTKAVVAFWGGRLILARLSPDMQPGWPTDFLALVLGALIYEILRAIPFLGWLIAIIVMIVGLGAIYLALRGEKQPAEPVPVA